MAAKLDTLPPELLLQILSHLEPIHYFPLKAAGSHYIHQIVLSSLPPVCELKWRNMIHREIMGQGKMYVPHTNWRDSMAVMQGRSYYVEDLIKEIKTQSLKTEAKVKVGFKLGGVEREFRWPKVKARELDGLRESLLKLRVALCLAASVNSEYIVRLILERERGMVDDIDACEFQMMNAFHGAVSNGHVGCARVLLKAGARRDVRGLNNLTAFHMAADNCDVEMMHVLLEEGRLSDIEGKATLDTISDHETSALSLAAAKGNLAIVRLLLNAGASINPPNGDWFIVMISAANGGNAEIMELLLEHFNQELKQQTRGSEFKKPNLWRVVDAAAAASPDSSAVIEKILDSDFEYKKTPCEKGSCITPLHIAASKDNVEAVKLFLDRGLYLDILTPDGLSPIQAAVYFNKLHALKVFVERGYSLTRSEEGDNKDGNELTLLHILAESPFFLNRSVLDYLLESGLDLHAKAGYDQLTPMHHAFGAQLSIAVRFLCDAGADINARGLHGQTPLMTLVSQRRIDGDKLTRVLSFKPDTNLPDDYGNRAIHLATYYSDDVSDYYSTGVETLMYHGAEVNAQNNAGQVVLHIAAQQNKDRLVNGLLRYCADANVRDHKLMTPLHYLRIGVDEGGSLTEIKLRAAWGDMEARDGKGRTPVGMMGLEEEKIVMPYERFTRVQWEGLKPKALYDPPPWTEFVRSLR